MNDEVAKAIGWRYVESRLWTHDGRVHDNRWRRPDGQYYDFPTYTVDNLLAWLAPRSHCFKVEINAWGNDPCNSISVTSCEFGDVVGVGTLLAALEQAVLAVAT